MNRDLGFGPAVYGLGARTGTTVAVVAALSVTAFGVVGWLGPFWAMPTAFLKDQAAAGGVALVNSMGAVGGFVGPYLLGRIKEQSGGCTDGLLLLAGLQLAAALLVLALRHRADGR